MSLAYSVSMISPEPFASCDDDGNDQGSTFDVDDNTTVLGPPVVTTPVLSHHRQRAQPQEKDDLSQVCLKAVAATSGWDDSSAAEAATVTTEDHAQEHQQNDDDEEDHVSTFTVDSYSYSSVPPLITSPSMSTRRGMKRQDHVLTKLTEQQKQKQKLHQQVSWKTLPCQDEKDDSASDEASESEDLHHDEHGSTFDDDGSTSTIVRPSVITSPTTSRRIAAARSGAQQMVQERMSPACTDSTARIISLHEEVDEELAIPRCVTGESSESLADDDSDEGDARNNGRLHCLYTTWTCWCPAMFISMLVICTVVTAVLYTKQSNTNSTLDPTPSPAPIKVLDPSQLMIVFRESLQIYSSPSTFLQFRSPQAQALQWLLSDILACTTPRGEHEEHNDGDDDCYVSSLVLPDNVLMLQQRFALVVLAMSCGVDSWSDIPPRTDAKAQCSNHECEWDGVDCVDGNVTSINLSALKLVGKVPVEVGFLSHLTHLDLSSNQLKGALPMSLFGMRSLQSLNMMENKLSFSINLAPFWRLTNLEHLTLSKNYITGELPSDFMTMTQLKTIRLGNTLIQGTVFDFIVAWPNAEDVRFEVTPFLVGTIPSTWLNTNLRHLDLNGVNLNGTIPTELGLFTQLTTLSLGGESPSTYFLGGSQEGELVNATDDQQRQLEGTLPSELGNLENLNCVMLTAKQLYTPTMSLGELIVSSSYIHGSLPTALARLTNLRMLIIAFTNMNGTIPDDYANILQLEFFSIYRNEVGGTVPEWLADLPKLFVVEVVGRNFWGTVPYALCSYVGLDLIHGCSIDCNCCGEKDCIP